ncbi:MAG TPA: phytanoyl-CoA dioxygenase family protein [Solirubrobacteraceae bacterium]
MTAVETVTDNPPPRLYPGLDRDSFRARGYAVVRGLFAPAEIETLREETAQAIERLQAEDLVMSEPGPEGVAQLARCDVLSISEVRHMMLDRRLVETIGELLGAPPTYFGESVLRIGKQGGRAWHRDNVNRLKRQGGLDWHDPYRILRCGIYMQDQAHHSGGLAVRPRSNRPGAQIRSLPIYIDAKPGDLIVWDLRTVHSGEVVRLRLAPRLPLHPLLQTRVPESMRVADERERMVMFMSFGLRGPHLDHYLSYLKTRKQNRELWETSRFGPEVWEQAAQASLDVLAVTPEYGTPPDAER